MCANHMQLVKDNQAKHLEHLKTAVLDSHDLLTAMYLKFVNKLL